MYIQHISGVNTDPHIPPRLLHTTSALTTIDQVNKQNRNAHGRKRLAHRGRTEGCAESLFHHRDSVTTAFGRHLGASTGNESLGSEPQSLYCCQGYIFRGAGERNRGYALPLMANKPETALYRAPTFLFSLCHTVELVHTIAMHVMYP